MRRVLKGAFLLAEFDHHEVTLCGGQDVKSGY